MSTWKIINIAVKNSVVYLPILVQQRWLLLLAGAGLIEMALQIVQAQVELWHFSMNTSPLITLASNMSVWLAGALRGALLLFIVPITIDCALRNRPQVPMGSFFCHHIEPLLIESLRVMGKTLLWSLLLILPGIWKQMRYMFVPLIVLLDPEYDEGNVHVLKQSQLLTGRKLGLSIGVFIGVQLLVTLAGAFNSNVELRSAPIQYSLGWFGGYMVEIFSAVFLYFIYLQLSRFSDSGENPSTA